MWKWTIWLWSTYKQLNKNNQEGINKGFMENDGWYGQEEKGKAQN